MSAPRVLIVVENLSVPFDRRVWQESRALVDDGYEVHVISPTGTKRDTEREVVLEGVHIHRYPLRPATGGPLGFVREYGLALFHSLRLSLRHGGKRRFDVVHVCNPPDLLFLVALPHKLRGAKVLFDHHDLVPELFRSRFEGGASMLLKGTELAERLTFAASDAAISTNESYREVALTRGRKDPADVTVVRSAPDLARFEMAEPEPELKRGKPFLACYLGVMGPQDGIDYALRALAHLKHDRGRADLHTVFMGSGDAFDDMVALASELDLDDCVEFTGRVSDADVCRYLSTADVCLAPDPRNPLNDVSTMNKIMEYMAMERPLVSFDLIEAKVSAGDAAAYATPNDVTEFGDLIAELLDDPERRAAMGALGRKRVEGELSWDHSRRHLLDAYRRLLGRS